MPSVIRTYPAVAAVSPDRTASEYSGTVSVEGASRESRQSYFLYSRSCFHSMTFLCDGLHPIDASCAAFVVAVVVVTAAASDDNNNDDVVVFGVTDARYHA